MAKLLIVEDDESVRTLAARALERAGYNIDVAADGALDEGAAALERHVDIDGLLRLARGTP